MRLADLDRVIGSYGSVLVAFSGGADSAFVLARAAAVLGPAAVVGATAVSASLPEAELAAAGEFARGLGVRWETPRTDEMSRDGYRANAGDRCFFCKAELVDVLGPLADRLGLAHVATGTNADDVRAGFRPGIRAAAERGAVTPLADAGLTKAEVRAASREMGPLDLGQAGRGLPVQPDRVRDRGHPGPAGPGRAGRGGAAGGAGRGRAAGPRPAGTRSRRGRCPGRGRPGPGAGGGRAAGPARRGGRLRTGHARPARVPVRLAQRGPGRPVSLSRDGVIPVRRRSVTGSQTCWGTAPAGD